jgi:purine-binding chemotaxis protein CheW
MHALAMDETRQGADSGPDAQVADDAASAALQHLQLVIGDEPYAVPIASVREIIEVGRMTALPMTPDFVRGVMNLRGVVIPVIDLNARFGRGATQIGRRSCIVIVELAGRRDGGGEPGIVGALVDAVSEVIDIAPSDVEPTPALGTRIAPQFIAGMAHVGEGLVIVLDLAHTLAEDDIASLIESHVLA